LSSNNIYYFQTDPSLSLAVQNITFNALPEIDNSIDWANNYDIIWGINGQMKYGADTKTIGKPMNVAVTKNDFGSFANTILGSYIYIDFIYQYLWTTGTYQDLHCYYSFGIPSKPFLIRPEFSSSPFDNVPFQGTWSRNSEEGLREYEISGYEYTASLNGAKDAKGVFTAYSDNTIRLTMTHDWYNAQWISLEDALSQWQAGDVKTAFFDYYKNAIPYTLIGSTLTIGNQVYTK
jgi:hypothetical protein